MALGVKKKLAWLDVGKMEIMEVVHLRERVWAVGMACGEGRAPHILKVLCPAGSWHPATEHRLTLAGQTALQPLLPLKSPFPASPAIRNLSSG